MEVSTLIKNVDYYFQLGLVKTKTEKNFLQSQLLVIKFSQELLNGIKNTPFMFSAKLRQTLISGLENQIANQIDALEKQIKSAGADKLDPKAKALLLAGLEYLKN